VLKKLIIFMLTLLLIDLFSVAASSAAVKTGSSCTKAGIKTTAAAKTYTCIKSGKKLVWSSGVESTQKFEFSSVCQVDPNSPSEWAEIESFHSKITCASFYKYVPYKLPTQTSKTALTDAKSLPNIETCKIRQPDGQYYPWRGFADPNNSSMVNYFKNNASPRPNIIIQVMPVSWPDSPYSGNPNTDYGRYFKFFEEWIKNTADNGSDVSVRVPDRYFPMPKPLSDYKDISVHGQPTADRKIFWNDAIAATDAAIDFTGVTLSYLVVPPTTPIEKFGGNPDGGGVSFEGRIPHILSVPPHNTTVRHNNSQLATPNMWLHEMSHAGLDIGDYYNSGIWGSVGSGRLDQLGWDKYIEGFMNDAQIRCASPNETSIHWIVPSAAKGPYQKLVVVPLSKNKVIVVESMRSAGYNYKLPKVNQGALVYTVDVSITAHGEGTDVYVPSSRAALFGGQKENAPMRVGEEIIISNVKITLIESGDFGDVIKVESAK
jgi:hypothetical protein